MTGVGRVENGSRNFASNTLWPGAWYPLGGTLDADGCNFSVFSKVAHRVKLCVFDNDAQD